MELVTQADLRLEGIGTPKTPHQLSLTQTMNNHAVLTVTIWLESVEAQNPEKYIVAGAYVVLTNVKQNAKPIFNGIINSFRILRKEGIYAAELKVLSYSWLMDRNKKRVSYQKSGRTWQELTNMMLSPYDGVYTWDQSGKEQVLADFLMQYEETDWEFLCRIAAMQAYPVYPEVRVTGVELCIGLPQNRQETVLVSNQYRIRSQMAGAWEEQETNGLVAALEYIIEEQDEDIFIGEPVVFLQRTLWVVEKKTYLKAGILQHDYVLRSQEYCRVNSWKNRQLSGVAISGKVTATSSAKSRLTLETDSSKEPADSWHVQGLYYTGGGAGYSGSPEKGDTQYLYFPTESEADRYVIGGGGTSYEKIEQTTQSIMSGIEEEKQTAQKGTVAEAARQTALGGNAGGVKTAGTTSTPAGSGGVTPQTVPATKSWTTPGKQSLSLSGEGLRLAAGGGISLSLTGEGITVQGKGDMSLSSKNISVGAKYIRMNAKKYIYLKGRTSAIALLPGDIHIKGFRVYLQDSQEHREQMTKKRESMSTVEAVMQAYEARKKEFVPLFASDGSAIQREGYDEIVHTEEHFKYFEDNIWGKDEQYPNTGGPSYTAYQSWLTDTYGKSTAQKINDAIFSLDGLQAALDIAGFAIPPADLANSIISLARGRMFDAAIDFVSVVPWLGDEIKASHMVAKAGKAIEGLEYTYKITGAASTFSKGVKGTIDAMDMAMGAYRGVDLADSLMSAEKTIDNIADVVKANNAIDMANNATKYVDALDSYLTSGKILNSLGDGIKAGGNAADTAKAIGNFADTEKVLNITTDWMKVTNVDVYKYLDEIKAMAAGGEGVKYTYRGIDVSKSLEVQIKVLDRAGNTVDTISNAKKYIDLEKLAKAAGLSSVDQLKDILKYTGMNADEFAKALNKSDIYDILKMSPPKIIGEPVTYSSYETFKNAYRGQWDKWSKANKPKGSPKIKKWLEKGGTITLETLDNGSYIWKYTMDGVTIPYVPQIINGKLYNVIKFPDQYYYPLEGVGQFVVDGFTGNREKDMKKALEYLKSVGVNGIPKGYVLHHDIENGVFQLIEEAVHKLFPHYGGHYYNSLK